MTEGMMETSYFVLLLEDANITKFT